MRKSSGNSELLDPTLDIVFKMLFANEKNKPLLISILNTAIQPKQAIIDVDLLNPEIPRDTVGEKGIILDIHAKLQNGILVNIEMQSVNLLNIRQRALYYWAKTYVQQLKRGKVHVYEDLPAYALDVT
mgnify:FL=1